MATAVSSEKINPEYEKYLRSQIRSLAEARDTAVRRVVDLETQLRDARVENGRLMKQIDALKATSCSPAGDSTATALLPPPLSGRVIPASSSKIDDLRKEIYLLTAQLKGMKQENTVLRQKESVALQKKEVYKRRFLESQAKFLHVFDEVQKYAQQKRDMAERLHAITESAKEKLAEILTESVCHSKE